MEITKSITENVIAILIVIFGAIVHASVQLKTARERKDSSFTTLDFFILIPISAFAGLIFGLVASLFFDSEIAVLLSSGVGSFLGIAGLNKMSNTILDILVSRSKK